MSIRRLTKNGLVGRLCMLFATSVLSISICTNSVLAVTQSGVGLVTPFFVSEPETCDTGGTGGGLSGTDNVAKIYNYLIGKSVSGKPLQDFHVAGIMGNMQHESGYQEQRLQGTPSGTITPYESLTSAQLNEPRLGWGLVQWTPLTKVINPLKAAGKNPNDLSVQLDFLLEQLNGGTPSGEGRAGQELMATTNVADATVAFEVKYERHAGSPQPGRITEAERILDLARASGLPPTGTGSNGTYVLGDSLAVGMRDSGNLSQKLSGANIPASKIEATVGISIGSSEAKIDADVNIVKSAGIVVVELGTNDARGATTESISTKISSMVGKIKVINPTVKIYWVNVYSSVFDVSATNNAITQQSSTLGYQVIDWHKEASTPGKYSFDATLGVHPSGSGYVNMSDFVVGALNQSSDGGTPQEKPVIALDPGHGGTTINRTDPETGLHDGDYNNDTERKNVFDVAQMAKTRLEQAGYRVVMTKNSAEQSVFLRDRANVGNNAKAALGISIHTQGDVAFGTWQQIYTQKVGLYRGPENNKHVFTDSALADKSMQYANSMKEARDSIEVTSGTTEIKDNSFDGRSGSIEPGNIPLVELWARVPWIYLEAGGNDQTGGLTDQQKSTYAEAIVSGVTKAIPSTVSTGSGTCQSQNSAGLSGTVLSYAWPEHYDAPFTDKKPEYQAAVEKAVAAGRYVGGGQYPGVDCGGFVTTLLVDSGFETGYNYGSFLNKGASNVSGGQSPWVEANWTKIGHIDDTSKLMPGDVAINTEKTHTFIYVGTIPGFSSKIASASYSTTGRGWRAPMAGTEGPLESNIIWYRKK